MRPAPTGRRDALVTAEELDATLHAPAAATRPTVTLLDVRQGNSQDARHRYASSHLPGAAPVALETMLAGRPGPAGRRPLPGAAEFSSAMRRSGVRNDRPVVVYDDEDGRPAARCWWLLRYYGHTSVRVLDGGLRRWEALGLPTETGSPSPKPGDFTATPGHMRLLDAQGAAAVAATGTLIDARASERFAGIEEPLDAKAGHIPGAVNIPFDQTMANVSDGSFASDTELADTFAHLAPGTVVGVYCGSGTAAARQVLALHIAGIDAGLYIGSWSNWISNSQRPTAT